MYYNAAIINMLRRTKSSSLIGHTEKSKAQRGKGHARGHTANQTQSWGPVQDRLLPHNPTLC